MNKPHPPPAWADRLLESFCTRHLLEEVQGDLHEMYGKWVEKHGERKAKWLYVMHVIGFFRPYAFKKITFINPTDMFKNYFTIALRNLLKNKVFSLINMLGLSMGTTCCLIIGIYVVYELSYDRFFPDADRIYRVVQEQEQAGDLYQVAITPAPLAGLLKTNYPEVEEVTGFSRIFNERLFQYQDKSFEEGGGLHVDTTFFKFFPLTVKQGSLTTFFSSANTMILTVYMAQKYFGDDNPIGKVIRLDQRDNFEVVAVLENPPSNFHLKFNFLLPMAYLMGKRDLNAWGNNWMFTYIKLKNTADAQAFENKIKTILSDHINNPEWQPRLYLQTLTDIHLHSNFDFNTDIADTTNIQSIYLFAAIGLIIILISCINFINLTTARSVQRSKEIGIRKVVGASRKQLIYQFMGESLLYAFIATIIAITLAQLLIPYFADLSGFPLSLSLLGIKYLVMLLLAILLLTGLLAGIYPALFLSAFKAIKILKGSSILNRSNRYTHISLRKVLVISQFSLSVILIVSAIIIRQQMHFVLNRSLGFDQEHVLYTPVKGDLSDDTRYQSFKHTLLQQASIVQVTRSNGLPINHEGSFDGVEWEGMPDHHQDFLMNYFQVDEDFVETFGLQILEGSNLLPRKPNDSATYYLVNETALKTMQMEDPIGKKLDEGTIVGVVKDFNFQSAFTPIQPMIMCSEPENRKQFIAIRIAANKMEEAIQMIGLTYKQFNPEYPVEYHFLDESIIALYDQQIRSGKLINLFAVLAVLISCLGLFGLSAFSAEQKTKEVGIRKVLGASVGSIVTLLTKDFLGLVTVAFLLATPVAWYAMNRWLQDFAYRIHMAWWMFALAGMLALSIALLTVSFQSIKAALTNPVKSLKYE